MIKSTTNKILLTNAILIILAIIVDKFWTELGLDESDNIYYAFLGVIIFGISVGGVFIGIKERKEVDNMSLIGLIGNSIIVLLFLILFLYIALTIQE